MDNRTDKPRQPCTKECQDRKVGCGATCEKWLAYEKAKFAYYEKKQLDYERAVIQTEAERKQKREYYRKRRRR